MVQITMLHCCNPSAGGLLIAKTGKHKRVIVFLTDGGPNFLPNSVQIISDAIANNITIYCVTIGMPAPQCLKDFSNQTGGLYFDNINTKEEAEECYRHILLIAQNEEPCKIEWQSNIVCSSSLINAEIVLTSLNVKSKKSYQPSVKSIASLEFTPESAKFLNAEPGIKKDQIIKVTAVNADFNVTAITSSNLDYSISPQNFNLLKGQSIDLTVSFLPLDSGYTYTKFIFDSDICSVKFYSSGGFLGNKPKIRTIKLISPNGAEVFVAGSDTVITWDGVLPEEKVSIEYSTDNGTSWIKICDSATNLSYNWRVPNTPSNLCLARVTAKAVIKDCPDVVICGKTWTGCNLNVDHYSNGDPIPEITNPKDWAETNTGAWCYYNNDPANGEIYGKLYNRYAIYDPRGLAPVGWHVSTLEEWQELENCLGTIGVGW